MPRLFRPWMWWKLHRSSASKIAPSSCTRASHEREKDFDTLVPIGPSEIGDDADSCDRCQRNGEEHRREGNADEEAVEQAQRIGHSEQLEGHSDMSRPSIVANLQGIWVRRQKRIDRRKKECSLQIFGTSFTFNSGRKTRHGVLQMCNGGASVKLHGQTVDTGAGDCLLLHTGEGLQQFFRKHGEGNLFTISESILERLMAWQYNHGCWCHSRIFWHCFTFDSPKPTCMTLRAHCVFRACWFHYNRIRWMLTMQFNMIDTIC